MCPNPEAQKPNPSRGGNGQPQRPKGKLGAPRIDLSTLNDFGGFMLNFNRKSMIAAVVVILIGSGNIQAAGSANAPSILCLRLIESNNYAYVLTLQKTATIALRDTTKTYYGIHGEWNFQDGHELIVGSGHTSVDGKLDFIVNDGSAFHAKGKYDLKLNSGNVTIQYPTLTEETYSLAPMPCRDVPGGS
jgi:hypothetical protein